MTIWYFTTGISLFESSRCWKLADFSKEILRWADERSEKEIRTTEYGSSMIAGWECIRAQLKAQMSVNHSDFQPKAKELVENYFRIECWEETRYRALPAELATFYILNDKNKIKESDIIRLICGISNQDATALLQAQINKIQEQGGLAKASVEITEPYSLDPNTTCDFESGFNKLWSRMCEDLNNGRVEGLVLTGGYKAILIAVSLRLGGLSGVKTPIYYLHEDVSQGVIEIQNCSAGEISIRHHRVGNY